MGKKMLSAVLSLVFAVSSLSLPSGGYTPDFIVSGSISTPNTPVSYTVTVSAQGIYKFYFSVPPMPIDVALKQGNTVLINRENPTSGNPMCYFLNPNVTYTLLLTPLVFGTCSFVINGKSVPSLSYVDDLNWSYMFRNPQLATTLSNTYGNSHYAVDIVKYNSNGNNICNGYKMYSVGRGTVLEADYRSTMGYFAALKLDSGLVVRYLHMNTQNDVMVSKNDVVTPSTYIGNVGSLGAGSTGPHLHFDINNTGEWNATWTTSNTYNPQLFFDEI